MQTIYHIIKLEFWQAFVIYNNTLVLTYMKITSTEIYVFILIPSTILYKYTILDSFRHKSEA